jgi:hypothetical protein
MVSVSPASSTPHSCGLRQHPCSVCELKESRTSNVLHHILNCTQCWSRKSNRPANSKSVRSAKHLFYDEDASGERSWKVFRFPAQPSATMTKPADSRHPNRPPKGRFFFNESFPTRRACTETYKGSLSRPRERSRRRRLPSQVQRMGQEIGISRRRAGAPLAPARYPDPVPRVFDKHLVCD